MQGLQVDIALMPVSGKFVMTVDEALEAVAAINPQVAIPMHVGRGIGTLDSVAHFQKNAKVPVELLPLEA